MSAKLYEEVKAEVHKLLRGQPLSYEIRPLENSHQQIVVAGENLLVHALKKRLLDLSQNSEQDIENIKEMRVPNIKSYQIEYLNMIGFAKSMAQKHNLKSFAGNAAQEIVTFRGSSNSIQISQTVMNDLFLKLKMSKATLDVKMVFQRVFQTPTTEQLIKSKLAAEQLSAVWCIEEDETILVYSESKTTSKDAIGCINSIIWSGLYPANQDLDDLEMNLLESDMWRNKVRELKVKFEPLEVTVLPAQRRLSLAALSTTQSGVMEQISQFFAENVHRTVVFNGVPNRITFLEKFRSEMFRNLRKEYNVKIGEINGEAGIELTGTMDNIAKCERRLREEHDNICREVHVIEHQALIRHLNEETDLIEEVGLKMDCMVVPHREEVIAPLRTPGPSGGTEIRYSVTLPSGTVCEVRRGDITTMACDAIVNAANGRLQHMGGLAAAIIKRGSFAC